MPITWPATLPLPTIDGYGVHPGEAILRTGMEAGPARQRRRFTQVPSRITVRWTFRRDQFALFEAWYRWRAREGGAWFEIDLLGGIGMSVHEARFARQFNATVVRGNRWQVTSELEIRERPVLTEDGLAIALDSDLSALFATLLTSNLPFDEWTEVFGSERLTGALLDRLTHHVHILEMNGDSFRLNQSKKRRKSPKST